MRAKRKYHDGEKLKKRQAISTIYVPPTCIVCKKKIKRNEWYYNKRAYEAHVKCVPKDLIE